MSAPNSISDNTTISTSTTATLLAMIVIVTRKETDLFIALSQSTVHVPTWRWAATLPIVGDMVGRFWDDDDVTVKTRDHEPTTNTYKLYCLPNEHICTGLVQ